MNSLYEIDNMGILAKDIEEFVGKKNKKNLGDLLYGRFKKIEVDSVKEVRKIRERN